MLLDREVPLLPEVDSATCGDLPSYLAAQAQELAVDPNSVPLSMSDLPDLFRGLSMRRIDAAEIELAQQTFNEEGLYRALQVYAETWSRHVRRPARILDLCSATGLCALRVAETIPTCSVTLVDTDPEALKQAALHFDGLPTPRFYAEDAVEFGVDGKFDLILMNSAYHHIEDRRKSDFLRNAVRLIATDGLILLGDHFLAPYETREQFRARVVELYREMVLELERRGEPKTAIEVIRQAAYHCWTGRIEYKVDFCFLQRDLASIEDLPVEILTQDLVWSPPAQKSLTNPLGSIAMAIGPPDLCVVFATQ
jgi:ubiquinone/menaquinone biosynthesis C-methylase UbiE